MDDAFSIEHLGIKLSFPATEENEAVIAEFMKQCDDGRGKNADLILEGKEIVNYLEMMGKLAAIQEEGWKHTREYMRRLKVLHMLKPGVTINLTALQRYMEAVMTIKEAKLKMDQLKYDHLQWQIDEQKWILSMQDWTTSMKQEQEALNNLKEERADLQARDLFRGLPMRENMAEMVATTARMRGLNREGNSIDEEGKRIREEKQRIDEEMHNIEIAISNAQKQLDDLRKTSKSIEQREWPEGR